MSALDKYIEELVKGGEDRQEFPKNESNWDELFVFGKDRIYEIVALKRKLAAKDEQIAALRERVEKLEARNKWWLENYDITMPCGHKNRYLVTKGNGDLVLDDEGNALCAICSMEEAQ